VTTQYTRARDCQAEILAGRGIPPALLATYTGDFPTVDAARKAAIEDADDPKIGAVDSITIEPIGERWVKGETLIKTAGGWERRREPE